MNNDEKYMREAIKQAKKAAKNGEVPIGCVIVYNGLSSGRVAVQEIKERMKEFEGLIVGRGYNRRNTDKCTLSHAEITDIKKASNKLGDWRLEGCTMYVTLEPCQMCAGAIIQSRIDRVVIGAMNPKAGCAGSLLNILQMPQFNHQVEITRGVLEEECSALLSDFFVGLRKRLKEEKAGGAPQEPLK